MAKRVSVDGWLFTVTLILVFVGLVMVFSASAIMAKEKFGSGYYFLWKQLGWAVAGMAAMVAGMKISLTHRTAALIADRPRASRSRAWSKGSHPGHTLVLTSPV